MMRSVDQVSSSSCCSLYPTTPQKKVNYRIWGLTYFDHVMRMNDGRYLKIALLGGVHGIRQRGRPPNHWIDRIKEDCGGLSMAITQASRTAQNRNTWRTAINGLSMHT